ncbi:UDP-glucose 4-epimerase [Mycobacteroides abscessus subsp. abscessus]|nr:UDP-glucose 4-epimerase [Mycobacteroides abscessus subsp. abscessus]
MVNLGTGKGATVKELVQAFEAATGEPLRSTDGPSRPGDVAGVLGWTAELTEADGIRDALAWLPRRRELLGF